MKNLFILLLSLLSVLFYKFSPPVCLAIAICCLVVFSFRRRRLVMHVGALVVLGIFFLAAPPRASAQIADATYPTVTNQPTTVASSTTTSLNSFVKLHKDEGLALAWKFNQSGANTSNAVLTVYSSVDGTNISTAAFATLTAASSGTTTIVASTNWSPAQLSGLDSLVIGTMQNTSGTTTLTNKALIVRRPN